jgi:hypothetical protein
VIKSSHVQSVKEPVITLIDTIHYVIHAVAPVKNPAAKRQDIQKETQEAIALNTGKRMFSVRVLAMEWVFAIIRDWGNIV